MDINASSNTAQEGLQPARGEAKAVRADKSFERLLTRANGAPELAMGFTQARPCPVVYVFDAFGQNGYSSGLGHGELVSGIISAATGVTPIPVNVMNERGDDEQSMVTNAQALNEIIAKHRGDMSNVYINMSFSLPEAWKNTAPKEYGMLEGAIKKAIAAGATIVVSAGNDYRNMLSDIPGVVTAGATRPNPLVVNPEVDALAPWVVTVRAVPGRNGFDVDGNGTVDIPVVGRKVRDDFFLSFEGTSASAPLLVVQMILTGKKVRDRN